MQGMFSIFYFIVFIFSVIAHEVAHGIAAEREGDPTARLQGRITLNPIKHIDLFGSIILPAILYFASKGSIVFGWAKPVPYNPDNLRNGNKSVAKVAIAGIIVNLSLALVFGLLIRILVANGAVSVNFIDIASIIVLVNIILAFFNAIPLAPLDGYNFLSAVLPRRFSDFMEVLGRYSLPLLVAFILFGWKVFAPLAFKFFTLLTGIVV